MSPGAICPTCSSDNWVVSDDKTPRELSCNDCGHTWSIAIRGDFKTTAMASYEFSCPECGDDGMLHFDIGQIMHRAPADVVPSLDGGHLQSGEPYCGHASWRWYNPPSADPPQLRPL